MRHLVNEHEAAMLFRPRVRILRQQHGGIDNSPRHWHRETVSTHQRKWPRYAKPIRKTLGERQPTSIFDARAVTRQSSDLPRPQREAQQDERGTDKPYRCDHGETADRG